jgi:hypothetical protein
LGFKAPTLKTNRKNNEEKKKHINNYNIE